ncbi:YbaB/EbfC family nucleoid-associated protein [Actinoplanes sp. L3-i22]|uniref:YbaB/EbfC family nucleoid-associated protein n=1 Tax=Actinoplanes sp. L3-i22 TaxID=2836373 RepID=UPI001C850637|nr:YbaB/EbfC family nucleoid-associated protein [Actinoplanes sp. L3-i22]
MSRPRGAAAALADRVATLRASASGADGAVLVTVASSGNVTDLELDDRSLGLGAPGLATEILRTIRRAQSALAGEVADAVEATVGAGTETGKAVLDSFTQRFPSSAVPDEPAAPVMPARAPFPSFNPVPSLPHQAPGNGFESGRDSRAR